MSNREHRPYKRERYKKLTGLWMRDVQHAVVVFCDIHLIEILVLVTVYHC